MYNEEKMQEYCIKYGVSEDVVKEVYYSRIQPFLSIITDFKIGSDKARHKELRIALGVNSDIWRVCTQVFDELGEALNAGSSVMKLKAQIDLQKGLIASEYKNAKLHDIQMLRYDDEYKKEKQIEEQKVNINITFDDASGDELEIEKEYENEE